MKSYATVEKKIIKESDFNMNFSDSSFKSLIKSKVFLFFYLPMFIYFVISCISFIFGSIFDFEIAQAAGKLIKYKWIKIIVLFYDEIGATQLFFVEILCLAILWECLVKILEYKTTVKFFSKWYFQWIPYIIIIVVWNYCNIDRCVNTISEDLGFGPGNDTKIILSTWYRFGMRLFIHIAETILICALIWYIRFKVTDKEKFITEEYYIGCIKMIFHVFITYFILYFSKLSFGRPFYFSVDFENIYNNELLPLGWTMHLPTDDNYIAWGSGEFGTGNAKYYDWWQPNDFFGNMKYWFNTEAAKKNSNSWWNIDFPSGHTVGTYCLFALFFYVIVRKEEDVNKKNNIIFWVFIVHITMMQLALLVYRFHWLTDLNFSTMFCVPLFLVANKLGDLTAYLVSTSLRKWTKQENVGVFVFNNENKKWYFYIKSPYSDRHYFISRFKNEDKGFKSRSWKYKLTKQIRINLD